MNGCGIGVSILDRDPIKYTDSLMFMLLNHTGMEPRYALGHCRCNAEDEAKPRKILN